MLSAIGLSSLDGLFEQIPRSVRLDGSSGCRRASRSSEIVEDLQHLAGRNRHLDELVCFAGAGAYDHYIPVRGLGARRPVGVLDRLHAVPAGALARHPADPVRVPVDGVRAHRPGGVERLPLRRGDGAGRGREHGEDRRAEPGPGLGRRGSETRGDPSNVREGFRVRAGGLRRRAGQRGFAGRRRRRRGGRRPAPQRLRDLGAGVGAVRRRARRRCEGRSRSSTRSPSVCWRRPGSSAPTSPSPRDSPSGTISPSAGPTWDSSRPGWGTCGGCRAASSGRRWTWTAFRGTSSRSRLASSTSGGRRRTPTSAPTRP